MTPRPRLRAAGSPPDRAGPRGRAAGAGPPRRAVAAGAHARAGRRRLITIGAAFMLAMALSALTNQYGKTYTLARDEARLEQRRRELIADNARLREEIDRLLTDDRYIEQIARAQLGLVRPGEVELLVVPYNGSVRSPSPAGLDNGRPPAGINESGGTAGAAPGPDAATPRPRRGLGVWVIGVRDAVLRLVRAAQH